MKKLVQRIRTFFSDPFNKKMIESLKAEILNMNTTIGCLKENNQGLLLKNSTLKGELYELKDGYTKLKDENKNLRPKRDKKGRYINR